MEEFFQRLIGNDLLATIIMSIVPLVELKGGIVFARLVGFGFFEAFGLAYVGSTVVFLLIFFLLNPVLELMKKIKWFNKLALKVEDYFKSKADQAVEDKDNIATGKKKNGTFLKQLGVFIFVAIPLI